MQNAVLLITECLAFSSYMGVNVCFLDRKQALGFQSNESMSCWAFIALLDRAALR